MPRQITVDADPPTLLDAGEVASLRSTLTQAAALIERDQPWTFGEVAVLLVSLGRITELHQQFFNDPSPTDIITFPYADPGDGASKIDGDIAICVEVVREHAEEANVEFGRELAFVAVHGLLHLAGWDDATDAERAAMHARQDAILSEVAPSGNR